MLILILHFNIIRPSLITMPNIYSLYRIRNIYSSLISCVVIVRFIDIGIYVNYLFIEDSDAFTDEDIR